MEATPNKLEPNTPLSSKAFYGSSWNLPFNLLPKLCILTF